MQGISDLLDSERGIFCIALVIACSVLTALGTMTIVQWIDYTKWIAAFLVASKTVTTAIETWKRPPTPAISPQAKPGSSA